MDTAKIAARLRALRGTRSLGETARANEISASALSMYEAGNRIPRDEIKIKLAKYYNTTVEALFYS